MDVAKKKTACFLGWKVREAEKRLLSENRRVCVHVSLPAKSEPVTGPLRVIKQEEKDGVVFLTACKVTDPYDE